MINMTDLPQRIRELPTDSAGRPVPWFVSWIDGQPDFRVADARKFREAWLKKKCWVCGQPLGKYLAFVIGPMCALNRVAPEPPNHLDCAIASTKICPFLSKPKMHRRERDLPSEAVEPPGLFIERNPGVTLVWVTRSYWPFDANGSGSLFRIGPPESLHYFCEGRDATTEQILASVNSGLPVLQAEAAKEGPRAEAALQAAYSNFLALLPLDQNGKYAADTR
jgi:hypothetical protein